MPFNNIRRAYLNILSHQSLSPHLRRQFKVNAAPHIFNYGPGEVRFGDKPSQEMVEHRAEHVHVSRRTVTLGVQHNSYGPAPLHDLLHNPVAGFNMKSLYPLHMPIIVLRRAPVLAVRDIMQPQRGAKAYRCQQLEVDELHSKQLPEAVVSERIEQ